MDIMLFVWEMCSLMKVYPLNHSYNLKDMLIVSAQVLIISRL